MTEKTAKFRFAPSPSGMLHLGNARIALLNHIYAKKMSGIVVFRIDDTSKKVIPECEYNISNMMNDITWLGIETHEKVRQSDRIAIYNEVVNRLKESGSLYPCYETKHEIDVMRSNMMKNHQAPAYKYSMNDRIIDKERSPHWRFKLNNIITQWDDGIKGNCEYNVEHVSDPILVKDDGQVVYNLASAVDDIEMNITHVIRGADHIVNTAVQIQLIDAIKKEKIFGSNNDVDIKFFHVPLIKDENGNNFSKRDKSSSIKELRESGILPMAINNFLASIGASIQYECDFINDLVTEFSTLHINSAETSVLYEEILKKNAKILSKCDFNRVIQCANNIKIDTSKLNEALWNAIKENVTTLHDIQVWIDVLNEDVEINVSKENKELIKQLVSVLPEQPWGEKTWDKWIEKIKTTTPIPNKQLFHTLRLALTGLEKGPKMQTIFHLINPELVKKRLFL